MKKPKKRKKAEKPRKPGGPRLQTTTFWVVAISGGQPTPGYKIVVAKGDRISWTNADAQDYWVRFLAGYPIEAKAQFKVPAGNGSDWYLVDADVAAGNQELFSYAILLNPNDPDPPPDGPGVIVDGG